MRASFLEGCLLYNDALEEMLTELDRTRDDDEWKKIYKDDPKQMYKRIQQSQHEEEIET